MRNLTDLPSVLPDDLVPFTDQLPQAVAANLARFSFGLSLLGADTGQIGLQLPEGGRHMGQDAGEREYRPGLWMIQFTALQPAGGAERTAGLSSRRGAGGRSGRAVRVGGRGAHPQVIVLRDVVMADGESFAITRVIMAEVYPDGQLLFCKGGDPGAFRQEVKERLRLDPADDDRWELARQFRCSARMLDVVFTDYSQWQLCPEDDHRAHTAVTERPRPLTACLRSSSGAHTSGILCIHVV
jgi:hypothetical protein